MLRLCIALLIVLLPLAASAKDYRAPQDVAWDFCHFIDSSRRDIFSEHFYGMATTGLLKSLRHAEQKNKLIATTYPDAIPPIGEASNDHAPFCRVDDVTYQRRHGQATISYIFPDTPEASWSDHLKLKNSNGVWKIDDIAYGNAPQLTTLRQVLKDAFPAR